VGQFLWDVSKNIFRHLQFTNWKKGLEDRIEDGEHDEWKQLLDEGMNVPRIMKLARTAVKRAMLRKMGPARASGKP
jgi:hypothetical protein